MAGDAQGSGGGPERSVSTAERDAAASPDQTAGPDQAAGTDEVAGTASVSADEGSTGAASASAGSGDSGSADSAEGAGASEPADEDSAEVSAAAATGEDPGGSTTAGSARAASAAEQGGSDLDELVVRPRKIRRVVIPVAAVLLIVFVVAAVLLRTTSTGVFFRVSDQVSMAALGVLLAAGALSLLRPRLRAGLAGIEVRNVIGTRRFDWDDVTGISFPDGASWARLELPDDEYTPVMAIQSSDGARAVQAMRDLRELRRRVDRYRS